MITAGGIVHWYVQLLFRLLLCPCRTTQHQEAPDHQQAYSSSHFNAKFFPFKLQNYCPFTSPLFYYLRVFLLDEQIVMGGDQHVILSVIRLRKSVGDNGSFFHSGEDWK